MKLWISCWNSIQDIKKFKWINTLKIYQYDLFLAQTYIEAEHYHALQSDLLKEWIELHDAKNRVRPLFDTEVRKIKLQGLTDLIKATRTRKKRYDKD